MTHSPSARAPAGARRTIHTTASYAEAERVVDWLSDEGFAVQQVSIVGTDLRYVEQISGRLTIARAALVGLGQGAWIGLFLGLFFSLFFDLSTGGFLGVLLYGVVTGALFGALWGALFQWGRRGRRDFASIAQTRADRYEVQVEEGSADEASSVVARMPAAAG